MIKFKIVTPERIMLETEVDSVSLPTPLGEITILPHHIPLVSSISPGELKYKKGDHSDFFAISGGFVEVKTGGEVVVLADAAEFGHEIDETRAQEARERAKELMRGKFSDEKSHAAAAVMIEKNLARIRVAKKHRSRSQHISTNG